MIAPAQPSRILIVKPSALGDVVTALPVLRALRRTFPDAQIDWLLADTCAPLLLGDPDLSNVVPFERKRLGKCWRSGDAAGALWRFYRSLKTAGYDWAIDLQGLFRSGLFTHFTGATVRAGFADAREGAPRFYTHKAEVTAGHTVDRNIELAWTLGIEAFPEDMRLHVRDDSRQSVESRLRAAGIRPGEFVLCVPPTRWETKTYPARHWRRVVADLARDWPVVLSGSPAPSELALCREIADRQANVFNWAGQTTVPQLVALEHAAGGVVCCDSATKFIAPAVETDCVVLIGPTRLERTGPYLRGRAVVADVPCQGCLRKNRAQCRHVTCMESISPAMVIAAARRMMEQRNSACRS